MVATGSTPSRPETPPGSTRPGDPALAGQRTESRPGDRIPPLVYILGGVIFLMGTTEFMVAGLLPEISSGLHVSVARTGLLITAFAAGMIVGAPTMSMATLRMPRRFALILALAVFAAGHVVAALSSSFWLLLGARFVTAIAVGAFWAVGAAIATGAAGPRARARAMGVMVGGLTLANVIGVPLGTAFGDALGWRGPFWILAGLALVAMPVIARRVPAGGERAGQSVRAEIAALRQVRLWVVLLAIALFEAGMIAAYSYVSPLLTTRAGLPEKFVPLALLGFGVGALLGTMTGGRLGDRRPYGTAIPAAALTACVLAATALWASNVPAAISLVVLLGATAFVLTPILVAQALHAASEAPTLVAALATSAFNVGNAAGSWLGGLALSSSLGLRGPALTGLALTLASIAPLAALAVFRPSPSRRRSLARCYGATGSRQPRTQAWLPGSPAQQIPGAAQVRTTAAGRS
jgi:DHA1 family inner membrane transport protein